MKQISLFLCLFLLIGCAHYSTLKRPVEENIIDAPIWVVWNKLVINPQVLVIESGLPLIYADGNRHYAMVWKRGILGSEDKIEVHLIPKGDKQTVAYIDAKLESSWTPVGGKVKNLFSKLKEESEKTPDEEPKGFWDRRKVLDKELEEINKLALQLDTGMRLFFGFDILDGKNKPLLIAFLKALPEDKKPVLSKIYFDLLKLNLRTQTWIDKDKQWQTEYERHLAMREIELREQTQRAYADAAIRASKAMQLMGVGSLLSGMADFQRSINKTPDIQIDVSPGPYRVR